MLDLDLLPEEYAVCRLPPGTVVSAALSRGPDDKGVVSVTWSADEVSVICRSDRVPTGATTETPWRCLRVAGPLDMAVTGVLASLVRPLADARINLIVFSTYATDYVLVPAVRLPEALDTLAVEGHRVRT